MFDVVVVVRVAGSWGLHTMAFLASSFGDGCGGGGDGGDGIGGRESACLVAEGSTARRGHRCLLDGFEGIHSPELYVRRTQLMLSGGKPYV